MTNTVVVYFSGYGHTRRVAHTVAEGAQAELVEVSENGDVSEAGWALLNAADGIIFGTPTYMGSSAWQFKKFSDATAKYWFTRGWQDKVFGGFTVSASFSGDKQVTLIGLQTLASQHGGIWVSLGLLPANTLAATRNDINNLGGSVGLIVQAPSDADASAIPEGDIQTALLYGQRVATIAARLKLSA